MSTTAASDAPMASDRRDANKAVVRRFVDEIFVERRRDAVAELLTEDFVPHTWGIPAGRDGLIDAMERVGAGLSDVRMTINELVAEGDLVAVRLTSSAVQSGPFMGMPPSGRRYEIGEMHLFRIRDGRVSEHWHLADLLGMMRQLGAMPSPGRGDDAHASA
jgi:steroid delta-isomerase-like uncharacterized protein